MIYKIAFVGFAMFVGAVCYTLRTVAKMANEEFDEMQKDVWEENEK